MSDFSKPEYATYVSLCRELRLKREWRLGDQFAFGDRILRVLKGAWRESGFEGLCIWLPDLSDWLEMLELFCKFGVGFGQGQPEGGFVAGEFDGWVSPEFVTDGTYAPTREEACARLWMAVRKPNMDLKGPRPGSPGENVGVMDLAPTTPKDAT